MSELFLGSREQPSSLRDEDPLTIPPRRPPNFHGEWYELKAQQVYHFHQWAVCYYCLSCLYF